jgi:hypothetical protein
MTAVQDKEVLMNICYLFTLGDLTIPHGVLRKRNLFCNKLIGMISPEMSCEVLKRTQLSYALIEATWMLPVSIVKATNNLLMKILNTVGLSNERFTAPPLDWLIECLKVPCLELKVACLRALIEKTKDHFHLCKDRMAWVT